MVYNNYAFDWREDESFEVETQYKNCDSFEQSTEVSIAPYDSIILTQDQLENIK